MYQWNCTEPSNAGQWFIPSERNREAQSVSTVATSLLIYHIPTLDDNCYGPVTAIEYCYRYNIESDRRAIFNWTVLILNQDTGNSFMINRTYVIQSYLSMDSVNCTVNANRDQVTCCDRTNINRFELPRNFIFGVTGSAQGSTRNAALMGFHDSVPEYTVNARLLERNVVANLSVGSSVLRSPDTLLSGIRMLWFVTGKH